MKTNSLKIYQPDAVTKIGLFSLWKQMIEELINSRELIWRLFIRDFTAKYRQAVLGVLWAVIMPLVMVGIFVFLNRSGVLNIGKTDVPYPVFALLGLTIWQLFSTGLTASSNSIIQGGAMVVKINFAKESLVISSFAQSIFEFFVRCGLLVAVFIIFRFTPSWKIILFPFTLIPLILLTIGLGFIFSLLGALMRDIPNIITLITTFLLFLTPVLYPIPGSGLFSKINNYNLVSHLIIGARDMVIYGYFTQPKQYLLASIFSVFVFFLFWYVFHLVEPRMAERV